MQPEQLGSGAPPRPAVELFHLFDRMKAVRAFVFDVDGVFTNNEVLVTEAGELLRSMHIRDGQAVKWAVQKGYQICIITGGRSEGVLKRLQMLGVQQVYLGHTDKLPVYEQFLQQAQLSHQEVCYMGDDLPDLPILRKVGLPSCPQDAMPEVMEEVAYVSPVPGGRGCVRDIIEKVMKLRGDWPVY
ncbi:MAG: KdsC family phosphatase [Chitinophagales bacterium]|jgi:3-deoxy-D-manno-octulosonate 8-phosphate phosphatase (KDO 8-P phosphatase)